jgi:isopentenyl-diphosphate delta-isomerase
MSTTTTVTQTQTITAENVLRLFPEVNTTLIGASAQTSNDDVLDGYDEEQIRLMDEMCIVLDNDDVPIGSASKKICESAIFPAVGCDCLRCNCASSNALHRPLDGEY